MCGKRLVLRILTNERNGKHARRRQILVEPIVELNNVASKRRQSSIHPSAYSPTFSLLTSFALSYVGCRPCLSYHLVVLLLMAVIRGSEIFGVNGPRNEPLKVEEDAFRGTEA
jgi:hypothetical protein